MPYPFDLYAITGFVNGDTASVVSGAPTATPVWGTEPNVGTYPLDIGVGTLSAANYNFTALSGTVAVVPAQIMVKPNGATMKYGTASLPTFGFVVTGLKYGQTASVLSAAPRITTTATAHSGVGSYPIAASVTGITAQNYIVVAGPQGTLNITPATLTARAANIGAVYNQPLPSLTYTLSGLVNGDTSAVVSGTATLTTTAVQGSPVASYPINFSKEGLSAANYLVTYASGTLTVRAH